MVDSGLCRAAAAEVKPSTGKVERRATSGRCHSLNLSCAEFHRSAKQLPSDSLPARHGLEKASQLLAKVPRPYQVPPPPFQYSICGGQMVCGGNHAKVHFTVMLLSSCSESCACPALSNKSCWCDCVSAGLAVCTAASYPALLLTVGCTELLLRK